VDASLLPVCVQIFFDPAQVDLINSKNASTNNLLPSDDINCNNNNILIPNNNMNNFSHYNPTPAFPLPPQKYEINSKPHLENHVPPPPPPPLPSPSFKVIFNEDFLKKEFSKYGNVIRVSLPRKIGGLLRGFAFVEFESNVSGEKVNYFFFFLSFFYWFIP
jgi:RNA recognition motif-containing protein